MADIVLMDRYMTQPEGESNHDNVVYVRLTVPEETGIDVPFYRFLTMIIEEKMDVGFVSCKMVIDDVAGSVFNVKPIEPDFEFKLFIGTTPESTREYTLSLNNIEFQNAGAGDSSNTQIELHLVSSFYPALGLEIKNRGWRNTKYSDVVSELIDEVGLNPIRVTETKDSVRHVLQPYWTNHQLLRYMTPRSRYSNGDTFFTFFPLPTNGFAYTTIDDLINNPISNDFDFEVEDPRDFIFSGDQTNPEKERRKIIDFKVNSRYFETMKKGAAGVRYAYYDFENRKYVNERLSLPESDEGQLSDWAYMSSDHVVDSKFIYNHRDIRTEYESRSLLSRTTNRLQPVTISINGTTDVQVGEVINILIPVAPEFVDVLFNEFYSGDYMITSKRTILDFDTNNSRTVFNLMRHGVNGTDVNNLVDTTTGRIT